MLAFLRIGGKPVVFYFPKTWFPQKEKTMHYVGVDLHKKTISVCVMVKASGKRKSFAGSGFTVVRGS